MTAIYAGSFDPFTNGHLHIVKQACEIFEQVVILIATNQYKNRRFPAEEMGGAIDEALKEAGITNAAVIYEPNMFVADFARTHDIRYLVRGLRNDTDYHHEEDIAKVNKELYPALHTIYLRTDNEIISSTFVMMLFDNGKEIGRYVPVPVETLMKALRG
jgi:pantetheine-phosphate adenylyltransferase